MKTSFLFNQLTFLDECGVAPGAADLDASFPAGNADFLFADRAFINVVGLSLLHQVFLL